MNRDNNSRRNNDDFWDGLAAILTLAWLLKTWDKPNTKPAPKKYNLKVDTKKDLICYIIAGIIMLPVVILYILFISFIMALFSIMPFSWACVLNTIGLILAFIAYKIEHNGSSKDGKR